MPLVTSHHFIDHRLRPADPFEFNCASPNSPTESWHAAHLVSQYRRSWRKDFVEASICFFQDCCPFKLSDIRKEVHTSLNVPKAEPNECLGQLRHHSNKISGSVTSSACTTLLGSRSGCGAARHWMPHSSLLLHYILGLSLCLSADQDSVAPFSVCQPG